MVFDFIMIASLLPSCGGFSFVFGRGYLFLVGSETIYHRLGLEPSQNPSWDLNPRGWDSNPAKTHGTWFQDLMKLRFLMSHHRKNSVRDKMVGKKWIYSDSERSTLHRQSVGCRRGRVWAVAEGESGHKM